MLAAPSHRPFIRVCGKRLGYVGKAAKVGSDEVVDSNRLFAKNLKHLRPLAEASAGWQVCKLEFLHEVARRIPQFFPQIGNYLGWLVWNPDC